MFKRENPSSEFLLLVQAVAPPRGENQSEDPPAALKMKISNKFELHQIHSLSGM